MSNLNRDFILYIDSDGFVTYFHKEEIPAPPEGVDIWPLVSVNTVSEAETLRVLFCHRDARFADHEAMWFLPGFKGTKEDLPFALGRFLDASAVLRNL